MGCNAHGAYECTCHMFMRTMNNLFLDMLDSGMAVFLDDILVYLGTVDEHFMLLEQVRVHLHQYTCSTVSLRSVASYATVQCSLAFNVMPEGMHISDLKVQSLSKWPVPTMVK